MLKIAGPMHNNSKMVGSLGGYIYMYIYIYVYTYIYIYLCTHMYLYMSIHIHIPYYSQRPMYKHKKRGRSTFFLSRQRLEASLAESRAIDL